MQSVGEVGVSAGFNERVLASLSRPEPEGVGRIARVAAALDSLLSTPTRRMAGALAAGLVIAALLVLPSTGVEFEVRSLGAAGTAPGSRLSVSVDRMVATNDRIAPIESKVNMPPAPVNRG